MNVQKSKLIILLCATFIACTQNEKLGEVNILSKECETITKELEKCKLYEKGILKSEGLFFKGQKINFHGYFNKQGDIISMKQFIVLEESDSTYLNQEIFFDEKGDTIKDNSYYYDINIKSDSVIIGDSIILEITANIPLEATRSYRLEIQMDYLEDINKMLVFVSDKLNKKIVLNPKTIGKKEVQGIILVGEFEKSDSTDIKNPLRVQKFYFNFSYRVYENE
jgi:hypothetical protein